MPYIIKPYYFLYRILDHINVMSYDFHGEFDNYVGHHTLLYSSAIDAEHNNSDWNIVSMHTEDSRKVRININFTE